MRRSAFVGAAFLTVLLLAAGTAWLATEGTESAGTEDPSATAAGRVVPARRAGTPGVPETVPDRGAAGGGDRGPGEEAEAPGDDWYATLRRRIADGALTESEAAAALAAAGRGRAPGGGLHEILRRAVGDREQATDDRGRARAQAVVAWVVDRALEPYRRDRGLFAAEYRSVCFGTGALDVPGGSPIRELRFPDAVTRMDSLRPKLRTWCFEELAMRAADRFRWHVWGYAQWRRLCADRGWPVPPDQGSAEARALTPASLADLYVRPVLADLSYWPALCLARLFADLGDSAAAAECAARTRSALDEVDPKVREWLTRDLDEVDAEIGALGALDRISRFRIPADAKTPALADWFSRYRRSGVAHAIGTDGPTELGTWDADMIDSYLEGGLPWAPEQWEAVRDWASHAADGECDGIRGRRVTSPHWDVFTDVSADFAAGAALVAESGYAQARTLLRGTWDSWYRVGARIYSRRADYEAVTHDHSGGHWIGSLNSILTFLDDPGRTDFEEFRYPVLVHEATHAALAWSSRGPAPAWMHEGLASFVERWDPTRSVTWNREHTRSWMRRASSLVAAREAGLVPSLAELLAIRDGWNADDFGPVTLARYAAAESLFVWLDQDPGRWKSADSWIDAVRAGNDPATAVSPERLDWIERGWRGWIGEDVSHR